jgi:dihydrofolate reductase
MRISIIAAMAENGVIGRGGKLPWHLADDLKRFKRLTMDHAIVMGRKTWESIGRPLPGRRMIVISRQSDYCPEGVTVVGSLDAALETARAAGDDEVFIAGGAEIYRLALSRADRLYITLVLADVEGDTKFPEIQWDDWCRVESESHEADAHNDYASLYYVFDRSTAETSTH